VSEGGITTRCGFIAVTDSNTCTTDAECAALRTDIPGIFCVQGASLGCGCGSKCFRTCPEEFMEPQIIAGPGPGYARKMIVPPTVEREATPEPERRRRVRGVAGA
jgi:hypothetical protein